MSYWAVLGVVCVMNVKHSVEVWAGCCVGMACLDPAAADQNWQTLPVSAAGVTSANTETQTALALKNKIRLPL